MTTGKYRRQREKAKKSPEARPTTPSVVRIVENDKKAQISKTGKQEHKEEPKVGTVAKIWKWINDSANGVIAIFTIVIAGIAILQTFIYVAQLDGTKISQRAFMFAKQVLVVGGEPDKPVPAGALRQVDVTFANSGQTWARDSSASINFYISDAGIPDDFAYPEDNHSQPVLVAPQGDTHAMKGIPEEKFSDIIAGKLMLFVYGDISYRDVFGELHRTEYMFQYAGYGASPENGKIVQVLFWQGPTHNCADGDCQSKKVK
jgi:hypothetical protein